MEWPSLAISCGQRYKATVDQVSSNLKLKGRQGLYLASKIVANSIDARFEVKILAFVCSG